MPVFGICRGLQAINVFSGGSLLQDVPSHAGIPYGQGPAHVHNMEIDPDSRLARALAEGSPEGLATTDADDDTIELVVNTYHHQAVVHDRLAPGLRAVGWAASEAGRLVEALESCDGRWIVAVQCHPERTESTPDEFEGVWAPFVRAARDAARRAGRRPGLTPEPRGHPPPRPRGGATPRRAAPPQRHSPVAPASRQSPRDAIVAP